MAQLQFLPLNLSWLTNECLLDDLDIITNYLNKPPDKQISINIANFKNLYERFKSISDVAAKMEYVMDELYEIFGDLFLEDNKPENLMSICAVKLDVIFQSIDIDNFNDILSDVSLNYTYREDIIKLKKKLEYICLFRNDIFEDLLSLTSGINLDEID